MGWSIRKGTTAAQKLPNLWEVDALKVCVRMAYLIRVLRIPACFVLNMDETGVLLQPGGEVTYHEIGASEVPITGADDKRQFTLLCTAAMSGDLLPFAALWIGKTSASLPKNINEFYQLALSAGHRFISAGEKHWSTVATMIQYVVEVVLPYRERVLAIHPEYSECPMILYLDVYWSHRADDFLNWLEESRPWTKYDFSMSTM